MASRSAAIKRLLSKKSSVFPIVRGGYYSRSRRRIDYIAPYANTNVHASEPGMDIRIKICSKADIFWLFSPDRLLRLHNRTLNIKRSDSRESLLIGIRR